MLGKKKKHAMKPKTYPQRLVRDRFGFHGYLAALELQVSTCRDDSSGTATNQTEAIRIFSTGQGNKTAVL